MEKPRKFPHKIEKEPIKLPEKWNAMQSVRVILKGNSKLYRVSSLYDKASEAIYNFKVRPDDVWVVTFPRSGTTLTQEMVWLIVNDDYETARKEPLIKRFPFLEMNTAVPDEILEKAKDKLKDNDVKLRNFNEIMSTHWITLENKVGRRFIKSHLPFALLPPELLTSGCKVIYVARNPKDVAISFFKFFFQNASDEDFAEFYELFQNDTCSPYWDHVIQGWEKKEKENYLFIFYEDLVKDMSNTIKKVANFLEKDMTDGQVEKLAEHLNIKNVRQNKSITRIQGYYLRGSDDRQIVRKGEVGGWRDYFSEDLNSKANSWIEENYKRTDLRFPCCL